jgi:AraC-like DNA-binding protein
LPKSVSDHASEVVAVVCACFSAAPQNLTLGFTETENTTLKKATHERREARTRKHSLDFELRQGTGADRVYQESVGVALSVHLLRYRERAGSAPPWAKGDMARQPLRRAVDYIHARVGANLSLADIANVACMRPYHFSRAFKTSTGLSLHQYVLRARVEKARELLIAGVQSLSEIAFQVAFCDQSYLRAISSAATTCRRPHLLSNKSATALPSASSSSQSARTSKGRIVLYLIELLSTDAVEKVAGALTRCNNRITQARCLDRSCAPDNRFESILRPPPPQNPFSTTSVKMRRTQREQIEPARSL